jgi:hypothetical protein
VLSEARRRVGPGRFVAFTEMMFQVAIGGFTGYETDTSSDNPADWNDYEARRIAEIGLGLIKKPRRWEQAKASQLTLDSGQALRWFSDLLGRAPFDDDLASCSDDDLARTRDDLRQFIELMEAMGGMGARQMGATDDATIQGISQLAHARPIDQAFLFLLWRALRASDLRSHIDQLLDLGRQLSAMLNFPAEKATEGANAEQLPTSSDVAAIDGAS